MAKRKRNRRKQQLDPRLIVVGAVALIAVLVIAIFVFREDSGAAASKVMADDFTLPTFTGAEVALSDFRGQYVLVNFWASWCPPCKAEMPDLHAYYQEYKDQGFTVLAVNTNDDPVKAQDFIRDNALTFPVVLDAGMRAYDLYAARATAQYGGSGLPTSALIGPDGELIKIYKPGAISRADLERDVTPLLRG